MTQTYRSNREFRASEARKAIERGKHIEMYAAVLRRQADARRQQDRHRPSVMSRVRRALTNILSQRRETHDSEGHGPWAKSLHRSGGNRAGSAYRSSGTKKDQSKLRAGKVHEDRKGTRRQSR